MRRGCGLFLLGLAAVAAGARAQDITLRSTREVQRLLLAADPPEISMPVWTACKDSPPANYDRNPFIWTGAVIDLTGKAVWNSRTGRFGTTAISPLHVVYADHVNGLYPVGTIIRFVAKDDEPVERVVRSSIRIGTTDIDLSTLDAPLPGKIHWYRVMPGNWFLRCSRQAPGTAGRLPCIIMDGNTQCIAVKDVANFSQGIFETMTPVDKRRLAFTRELHPGDSGTPMFILYGGELILDGIYHTAQGGSEVSACIPALNAAMRPSGFQVTVADFSDPRVRQ